MRATPEVPIRSLLVPSETDTIPVQILKRKGSGSLINFMTVTTVSKKSDIYEEVAKFKNVTNRETIAYSLQEHLITIPEIRATVLLDDDSIPSFIAFEEEAHSDILIAYDLFQRLRRLANCNTQVVTHLRAVLFMPLPQ